VPNTPKQLAAVAMVTALNNSDRTGFEQAASEFDSPTEALMTLGRLTTTILTMAAQMTDPPMDRDQLWAAMAQGLATFD
jgi:hypothetical protein